MGKKKGKKSKKSEAPEADAKGKKGSKGSKSKKGKKSKKSTVASVAPASFAAPPPPVEEPPPPPPPPPTTGPSQCEDQLKPADPCRYTDDACCKTAMSCKPNHYPGMLNKPETMAVVGSQCGGYGSLCKLLNAGFRCAARIFAMVPWGNYVIIRETDGERIVYFLYDGCSCNVNRFRYMDLNCGTAGFLYFESMHDVINYILSSRDTHRRFGSIRKSVVDDICKEYCEYGNKHSGGECNKFRC